MTDPVIIAEREKSGMVAVWNEYLCLTKGENKPFQLFTGRYTALAARDAFYNKDTDDFDLPNKIDDMDVYGIEDDWVVGGELSWLEDSDAIEFDNPYDPALWVWLKESNWNGQVEPDLLKISCDAIDD